MVEIIKLRLKNRRRVNSLMDTFNDAHCHQSSRQLTFIEEPLSYISGRYLSRKGEN